jgi:hypothetical protein
MRLGLLPKKALDAAAASGKNAGSRDDKTQGPTHGNIAMARPHQPVIHF